MRAACFLLAFQNCINNFANVILMGEKNAFEKLSEEKILFVIKSKTIDLFIAMAHMLDFVLIEKIAQYCNIIRDFLSHSVATQW